MRIIVCVKQVPGTSNVEVDKETGVLKRAGIECKMNPYDLYALETALWIKGELGGTVTAVSMGPPQAQSVIKEAFMMGADKGYLLTDMKFAGADVLATSYTLSQGIKKIGGFDIIVCGKQTTDGDTAQVGPALAEHLNIPHVAWVRRIVELDEKRITVEQEMSESVEVAQLEYPCLITVEKDIFQPRLPSFKLKQETSDWPVAALTFNELVERDERKYGLKGSPTQVERIFPPEVTADKVIWEEAPCRLAENCCETLKRLRFI